MLRAGGETDATLNLPSEQGGDVDYRLVTYESAGLLTTYDGVLPAGPDGRGVYLGGGRIEVGGAKDFSPLRVPRSGVWPSSRKGDAGVAPTLQFNAAFSVHSPALRPFGTVRQTRGQRERGLGRENCVSAALFTGVGSGVEAASNAATRPEFLTEMIRSIELSHIKA